MKFSNKAKSRATFLQQHGKWLIGSWGNRFEVIGVCLLLQTCKITFVFFINPTFKQVLEGIFATSWLDQSGLSPLREGGLGSPLFELHLSGLFAVRMQSTPPTKAACNAWMIFLTGTTVYLINRLRITVWKSVVVYRAQSLIDLLRQHIL